MYSERVFQSAIQQHVNNIYLESRHNQIIGTPECNFYTSSSLMFYPGSYILNSELPVTSPLSLSNSRRRQFPSKGLDKKNWRLIKRSFTPNAYFQTRHGSVSLNLATAGFNEEPTKTNVQVKTRHGKINVNIVSISYTLFYPL